MIVSIHQPNYIPWIGYFYKIIKSDVFVILDDVQFVKNSFADRNSIKTPQGSCFLKIPVDVASVKSTYNEVQIKDELNWRSKHLKTIEMNYKRSKYFVEVFPELNEIFSTDIHKIGMFNSLLINYFVKKLGINTRILYSSNMNLNSKGTERLIDIIKLCNGTIYLSGKGGEKYQEEDEFLKNNIKLIYSDFTHPVYNQLWGEFMSNLSILDLFFNCGYDESYNIISNSGRIK